MRRVFFSFKYDDVWKANVVRKSWDLASPADRQAFGFVDAAEREQLKQQGDAAIAEWIREQMHGTSVTVVLMGAQTCESRWVRFEIEESVREGKGLLGIRIHRVKDPLRVKQGESGESRKGKNLFRIFRVTRTNDALWNEVPLEVEWRPQGVVAAFFDFDPELSEKYDTYDWVSDDGRENIARWIESAAKKAGR